MTMRGITLITADGIHHNVLVAQAGAGISISRDPDGRMVIDFSGGGGSGGGGSTAISSAAQTSVATQQAYDNARLLTTTAAAPDEQQIALIAEYYGA